MANTKSTIKRMKQSEQRRQRNRSARSAIRSSLKAARTEVLGMWPPPIADMLLRAYAAAVGLPAFVTSTVADLTGAPAATFRQWADDHARDFLPAV